MDDFDLLKTDDESSKLVPDVYLGHGVYASFDGYHIVLDLRGEGFNLSRIALEPIVIEKLLGYQDRVRRAIEKRPVKS